jgi:hypothetical protein
VVHPRRRGGMPASKSITDLVAEGEGPDCVSLSGQGSSFAVKKKLQQKL